MSDSLHADANIANDTKQPLLPDTKLYAQFYFFWKKDCVEQTDVEWDGQRWRIINTWVARERERLVVAVMVMMMMTTTTNETFIQIILAF